MMAKEAHTRGPWFAVPYGDGEDTVICRDEAGNKRIAFMAVPGSRDEQERRKAWAEIKANARLIAAAPLMFDALDASVADVVEMANWPEDQLRGWAYAVARNAQIAIAEARDEE